MHIEIDQIKSKTALIETAKALREMARAFEIQADILNDRRNYHAIGKHDISGAAKAVKYLKALPDFPALSAAQCRKICDRFSLDYLPNVEILMSAQTKRRAEIRKKRNQAMRKMNERGVKNLDIARRFDLSPAQVSAILKPKIRTRS